MQFTTRMRRRAAKRSDEWDQSNRYAENRLLPGHSHIPALDGIRGLAVLLVMICHFASTGLPDTSVGVFIHRVLDAGWSGVDLFFVLSGFLITGILYDSKNQDHYFRNYYFRRLLRIFPLYYGFLFVFFVLIPLVHPFTPVMEAAATRQVWLWSYSSNLVMAWEEEWIFHVDWLYLGHFWTLAIEEQFYLIWPFIVFVLSRRALIRVCIACISVAFLLRMSLALHGAPDIVANLFTFCRFDALAIGAMAALLMRGHYQDVFRQVRFFTILAGTVILILSAWRKAFDAADPVVYTIGFTILGFFFAGLLILAVEPRPNNTLAQGFSHPTLMWFGKYSYALYVFHVSLMPVFERLLPDASLSAALHSQYAAVFVRIIISILASSVAAYLSWHLYEKHFLKLKRHFVAKPVTTPPNAAVGDIPDRYVPVGVDIQRHISGIR